jgi:hypothetical protein
MILATCRSVKTFSFVGKQAGASIPTCSTESGGAKFRKKEWQRIGDEIKVAFVFSRAYFVNVVASWYGVACHALSQKGGWLRLT